MNDQPETTRPFNDNLQGAKAAVVSGDGAIRILGGFSVVRFAPGVSAPPTLPAATGGAQTWEPNDAE